MRFALYMPGHVRGIKVAWDVALDYTDELRDAMHPHELIRLRPGILRRGFVIGDVTHARGARVFANDSDTCFWIELPG